MNKIAKSLSSLMALGLVAMALTSCCCDRDPAYDPCPRPCAPRPCAPRPCCAKPCPPLCPPSPQYQDPCLY